MVFSTSIQSSQSSHWKSVNTLYKNLKCHRIRHKNDYGAILLLDDRFGLPYNINQLSLWVRPFIKVADKFHSAIDSLELFLKANQNSQIQSNPSCQSSVRPIPDKNYTMKSDSGHFSLLKQHNLDILVEPTGIFMNCNRFILSSY